MVWPYSDGLVEFCRCDTSFHLCNLVVSLRLSSALAVRSPTNVKIFTLTARSRRIGIAQTSRTLLWYRSCMISNRYQLSALTVRLT
jgi:hypothetical protein